METVVLLKREGLGSFWSMAKLKATFGRGHPREVRFSTTMASKGKAKAKSKDFEVRSTHVCISFTVYLYQKVKHKVGKLKPGAANATDTKVVAKSKP